MVSDFHFGPYFGQKTSLKLNDFYCFFRVVNLFLYSLQTPLRGKVPNTDDFEVCIHTLLYDSGLQNGFWDLSILRGSHFRIKNVRMA